MWEFPVYQRMGLIFTYFFQTEMGFSHVQSYICINIRAILQHTIKFKCSLALQNIKHNFILVFGGHMSFLCSIIFEKMINVIYLCFDIYFS